MKGIDEWLVGDPVGGGPPIFGLFFFTTRSPFIAIKRSDRKLMNEIPAKPAWAQWRDLFFRRVTRRRSATERITWAFLRECVRHHPHFSFLGKRKRDNHGTNFPHQRWGKASGPFSNKNSEVTRVFLKKCIYKVIYCKYINANMYHNAVHSRVLKRQKMTFF